jgi:hypothetical protein
MRAGRNLDVVLLAALAWLPTSASAQGLLLPVGGRAITPIGRVACATPEAAPVLVEGAALRVIDESAIGQQHAVRVAADAAGCATTTETATVTVVGRRPTITSVSVESDAGRLVLHGRRIADTVVRWSTASRAGADVCAAPSGVADGDQTCVVPLPRDLPADPTAFVVAVYPAGTPRSGDVLLADGGAWRAMEDVSVLGLQFVVQRLLAADAGLDVSSGVGRLSLQHPESVVGVACTDAACTFDGSAIVVQSEHGTNDVLELHFTLRPRVAFADADGLDGAPTVEVALHRCRLELASASPFAGADVQRLVLALRDGCGVGGGLQATVGGLSAPTERTVIADGAIYLVLRAPARLPLGSVVVAVTRGGTTLGAVEVETVELSAPSAHVELGEGHVIDFLPTNREACVRLEGGANLDAWRVDPRARGYALRMDTTCPRVRASTATHGSVSFRLQYVASALPAALGEVVLLETTDDVVRPVRSANSPVSLTDVTHGDAPMIELTCGDGEGHITTTAPGITRAVPYRGRDTCRLVLHRERLPEENGTQTLAVEIVVESRAGTERTGGHVSRTIHLRPGTAPVEIYVSGVERAFDRAVVRVRHDESEESDVAVEAADAGATQVQWTLVFGTEVLRLYATAALPTGLYRVSDHAGSGTASVSLGVLLRLVVLSPDGAEFPVGLEAGVLWVGIAGTGPSSSTVGEAAVVGGFGIGIPVTDAGLETQTSINLHAWFEWEVSRALSGETGSPYGFIFGPSFSIGNAGSSF